MISHLPETSCTAGSIVCGMRSQPQIRTYATRATGCRGLGTFQQDGGGTVSWEDRMAVDMFEKRPEMSRAQSETGNLHGRFILSIK